VLTNDVWNRFMGGVGGCPVAKASETDPFPVLLDGGPWRALPSWLIQLAPEDLGGDLYVASSSEMRAIEETLHKFLGASDVLGDLPRSPSTPAGPTAYPRWGQIYYGPPAGGEPKRYVVVSTDSFNSSLGRSLVVRTTSRAKRDTKSFPAIQRGAARACCGDIMVLNNEELAHGPRSRRPHPNRLSLDDMVSIASGLGQTHEI